MQSERQTKLMLYSIRVVRVAGYGGCLDSIGNSFWQVRSQACRLTG
jgi:hypothetical protein